MSDFDPDALFNQVERQLTLLASIMTKAEVQIALINGLVCFAQVFRKVSGAQATAHVLFEIAQQMDAEASEEQGTALN